MESTKQSGRILRKLANRRVTPNLSDYEATCRTFSWEDERRNLAHSMGNTLNIGCLATDRHAQGPSRDRTALRCVDGSGDVRLYTYGALKVLTDRFADVLRRLGVQPGDRVFSLTGRVPELYIAALGALKAGAVFCPLFSAYGPSPFFLV